MVLKIFFFVVEFIEFFKFCCFFFFLVFMRSLMKLFSVLMYCKSADVGFFSEPVALFNKALNLNYEIRIGVFMLP